MRTQKTFTRYHYDVGWNSQVTTWVKDWKVLGFVRAHVFQFVVIVMFVNRWYKYVSCVANNWRSNRIP
jgi:hypothetical protein